MFLYPLALDSPYTPKLPIKYLPSSPAFFSYSCVFFWQEFESQIQIVWLYSLVTLPQNTPQVSQEQMMYNLKNHRQHHHQNKC